jgi:hypothetical protein
MRHPRHHNEDASSATWRLIFDAFPYLEAHGSPLSAFSCASPAFAQSFDSDFGTGNELPSFYDQNGALHAGNGRMQSQIAVHRSALNCDFAS